MVSFEGGDTQFDTAVEPVRVLLVDDEPGLSDTAAEFLERYDDAITTLTASDASNVLDRLHETAVDAVVSDYDMPGMNGLDLLEAVRAEHPELPFILFTGKGSEEIASEAISRGVTDYLQKETVPEQYELLANRITNAVSNARAERALVEQEAWYRGLIDGSIDILTVLDPDGTYEYLSPAVEDILGYEPEELVGESAFERIHPDDTEHVREQFERLYVKADDIEAAEFRYREANGGWRWLEARGINRLDDRVVEGIVANVRDISDRKARERELERYETIVETVEDGIYTLDAEGCFTAVNDYIVQRTGYDREELLGADVSKLLADEDVETGATLVEELLTTPDRRVVTQEATVETATGETVPVELRIALLPADDGFRGTAGIARVITERKRRERKLERQNERLEAFASVVSHDLRSPLNVAEGQIELARREHDSEHLAKAAGALDRMDRLVTDLLELAQSGETIEEFESVALETVVGEAWSRITADGDLHVDVEGGTVRGDPARLVQAFQNLFRNAIDHAGSGVSIRVGRLADRQGFYVEDDGPGIPPDERDRVFYRGYSTGDEGTGFGLAIVESIVEAHDWTVEVTEGSAGGARFEVTGVTTDGP